MLNFSRGRWAVIVASLALLTLTTEPTIARSIPGLELNPSGSGTIDGLQFQVVHFGANWSYIGQSDAMQVAQNYPRRDAGSYETRGTFRAREGERAFEFTQSVTPSPGGKAGFRYSMRSAEGIQTNSLGLSIALPAREFAGKVIRVNQREIELPRSTRNAQVAIVEAGSSIEIRQATSTVRISGTFSVLVQDDRQFGGDHFSVRIGFTPSAGLIRDARLQLELAIEPRDGFVAGEYRINQGSDWKPIAHTLDTQEGSALDFSNLLDAPAGKNGHLVAREGRFEFASQPGKRVKFLGTNLMFSACYLEKPEADALAHRLARRGYNVVRLHHYDDLLLDPRAANSFTPGASQLDRLHYLVHALKQRGIYVVVDLWSYRQTRPGEIAEVPGALRFEFRPLVFVSDSAMRNWRNFASALLSVKNPYTGLSLAEDPALIHICPINEDTIFINWQTFPSVRRIYETRFEAWLAEQRLEGLDDSRRAQALNRFLIDLQIRAQKEMSAHLRGLGYRGLITGANFLNFRAQLPIRAQLDFIDNHAYWDHPSFPAQEWRLPFEHHQRSVLNDHAAVPVDMAVTRVHGIPFITTEYNYTFPNRFRFEAGPVIGAYAALQDWDGIYRFGESHDRRNLLRPTRGEGFDASTDPISILSDRIAALLFLRGDVSPAEKEIIYAMSMERATAEPARFGQNGFPLELRRAALIHRVSTRLDEASESPDLPPVDSSKEILSDTGQVRLHAIDGTFHVITPRSESLTLSGSSLDGAAIRVSNVTAPCTVFVSSLTDQPLVESRRLVIFHLTDVQNSDSRFSNARMTRIEDWGKLPHLVRVGQGVLTIQNPGLREATLHLLDLSGSRLETRQLPPGAEYRIELDSSRALAYELERK